MKEKEKRNADYAISEIRKINDEYSDLKTNNEDAYDYYYGKNYMKDVPGRSKVYTSDLSDTIEWVMPSLIRIFAGGDDVASLAPRKESEADQVKNHNELINYQMKVKNKWFIVLSDWFKDALLLKRGAAKRQWYSAIQKETKTFKNLTPEEYQAFVADPEVEQVMSEEIQPDGTYNCTLRYEYKDEYPLIEAVPPEEYGFPIDTRDIETCRFFYHRVKYSKWAFIKRFGEEAFAKIEEKTNEYIDAEDDSITQARFEDMNGLPLSFFYAKEEDEWITYECFYTNPDSGEPWLQIICGTLTLEDEINKYDFAPFRIITPIKLAHRVIGLSFYDLLKDLQKIRTSLLRQMLDNVYYNNDGRTVVNPTMINMEDFLNGQRPGGVIRTLDGMPANEGAVMPLPTPQMPNWAFNVLELMNTERDYHTGVTRSFQGVNPDTLNKTFRGQNQQITQAQQRIELMARLFAEMGVAPLIRDVVNMNIKFMSKPVAIKVVDEWLDVTPEDVVAKADVIINVGLGTTSKETLVAQNQQMIALYLQLYQIFGPQLNGNILHALSELVKAMGYRDTQNWVPNTQKLDLTPEQAQMIHQILQQVGGNGGNGGTGTQPGQEMPEQGAQGAQPAQSGGIPDFTSGGSYFG